MHLSGHMGRCMILDGLQAVALRLDDDSKYLHVLTMPVSAFTSKGGVKMCRELQPVLHRCALRSR